MYSAKQLKKIVSEKKENFYYYRRKVRMRFSIDSKKIDHLKPTIKCKKKWYGNSYGGFYVNPHLIDKHSIVYSFGIGKDISFDRKIISRHKCKVFGFDPTPTSIDYINSLPIEPLFAFYGYGISTKTGIEKFYLPEEGKGISGSLLLNQFVSDKGYIEVKMKSFDDISNELGHQHVDIVKMDIEGAEYEVLETLMNSKVTIKQLLVEFHDRFYPEEIKSKQITELLNKNGFEVFASSLNYEEISFINTKI